MSFAQVDFGPQADSLNLTDGPLDPVVNSIAAALSKDGKAVSAGQVLLQWAAAKGFAVVTTTSKPSRMDVGVVLV